MLPKVHELYEMHTDASTVAIGAVLYREEAGSGDLRPVAYESHKLSNDQRQYAMHELSCCGARTHIMKNVLERAAQAFPASVMLVVCNAGTQYHMLICAWARERGGGCSQQQTQLAGCHCHV